MVAFQQEFCLLLMHVKSLVSLILWQKLQNRYPSTSKVCGVVKLKCIGWSTVFPLVSPTQYLLWFSGLVSSVLGDIGLEKSIPSIHPSWVFQANTKLYMPQLVIDMFRINYTIGFPKKKTLHKLDLLDCISDIF